MKLLKYLFALVLLVSSELFAQDGALPFTTEQQSVFLLGAGQIGTALPSDDVLGFYLNPSILGYSSRINHASISIMPSKAEWWLNSPDINYHNYGINLGYNLESTALNLPISVGLGFLHNKFNYGNYIYTNPDNPNIINKLDSYDAFNCFSLGVGIDYYLKFNLGLSIKTYDSALGGSVIDNTVRNYHASGNMMDYGALIILPISELLNNIGNVKIDNSDILNPILDFGVGYSIQNIGKEIYYVDPAQSDPLSKTARLGYYFDFGYDLFLNKTKLNLFTYSFSADAEDILIKNEFPHGNSYQSGLGDIKIVDNLLNLKGDENVRIHKAHIFIFFDTFTLTFGRFFGANYSNIHKTDGIGISLKGLFSLISKMSNNETIDFITNHLELEYYRSNVEFYKNTKTAFDAVSIHFKGFEL
jgi:hypothetical protein